jgi:hypothetical protein
MFFVKKTTYLKTHACVKVGKVVPFTFAKLAKVVGTYVQGAHDKSGQTVLFQLN